MLPPNVELLYVSRGQTHLVRVESATCSVAEQRSHMMPGELIDTSLQGTQSSAAMSRLGSWPAGQFSQPWPELEYRPKGHDSHRVPWSTGISPRTQRSHDQPPPSYSLRK